MQLEFDFLKATSIPLSEVEPAEKILKRFRTGSALSYSCVLVFEIFSYSYMRPDATRVCAGAMSYGSISMEAHATLAQVLSLLLSLLALLVQKYKY